MAVAVLASAAFTILAIRSSTSHLQDQINILQDQINDLRAEMRAMRSEFLALLGNHTLAELSADVQGIVDHIAVWGNDGKPEGLIDAFPASRSAHAKLVHYLTEQPDYVSDEIYLQLETLLHVNLLAQEAIFISQSRANPFVAEMAKDLQKISVIGDARAKSLFKEGIQACQGPVHIDGEEERTYARMQGIGIAEFGGRCEILETVFIHGRNSSQFGRAVHLAKARRNAEITLRKETMWLDAREPVHGFVETMLNVYFGKTQSDLGIANN
ncbi:hypothetical protein [Pelagimonas varians]|nr:hypothetical protein [Pelagimonas varians]